MEAPESKSLLGRSHAPDDLKISLKSKKLRSGKCQAKFFARAADSRAFYGYALVDSHESLKKVVAAITERIQSVRCHADYRHMHLYAIKRSPQNDGNIIIYET